MSNASAEKLTIIESAESEDSINTSLEKSKGDKIAMKTQEILGKRQKDFKAIEAKLASNKDQTLKENKSLTKEISEIILRQDGKHRCLFNMQDSIFSLEDETKAEKSTETSSCNSCCNSLKKPKFCQFCACANCSNCLIKTRPYPMNNPEHLRRGTICL